MKRLGFDLVLLGDPTAGKDTQAEILKKKYTVKLIESGKYWRRKAKETSKDGAWLRATHDKGLPTPVPLMRKFLKEQVSRIPKNTDLVFVGNPRLKPEAQLLSKLLKIKKRDFFVLYLKLSKAKVIERTKSRSRSRKRSDDLHLNNRLKYFELQVTKTVKYYKSLGKLKFINGNQPINKVSKDIEKALARFKA
ncbi:MAG: nucleoside monophosphate kinase [bacterium]|nr:nucleoside monophosphate kinase [bacterium]